MNELRQLLDQDGYAVIPGLLDKSWIARLKAEEARFAVDSRYPLSVVEQLVHRSAVIREFAIHGPQIPLTIEALGPDVCFTHQQFITKRPEPKMRTDVPWHQDNGYGRLDPPNDLTIWMTLDDSDETNGCLWVIPASHQQGDVTHQPSHGLMAADVVDEGVALPMKAGDAVVFGGLLLHRSLPNTTANSRVAMYVRYCTPQVTMASKSGKPVLDDGFSWMVAGESH